jgi:uncharacterized protein (TIGR01777 family)
MNKVLITGASGMIGKQLSKELLRRGYTINALSRNKHRSSPSIQYYEWDITNGEIDEAAFNGIDTIIHLAGESIGGSRWTKNQKHNIITSRTDSINLIYKKLQTNSTHQVKTVISISAVGFYGDRGNNLLTEETEMGTGFLSDACMQWETAVLGNSSSDFRTVILRSGLVLNKSQGALPQMAKLISLGLGSSLGSGKQWVPWIHLKDVVSTFIFTLENENINGVYNMVAPEMVTNEMFTKAVAKELKRPIWLPNVPSFVLKGILGEQSHLLLDSAKVSSEKLQGTGFVFEFPEIKKALRDIYQ